MKQSCHQCQSAFEVTEDDLAFYDRVSPSFAGKKCSIPPPKLCPDCRQRRRLVYCNEMYFYQATCDLCNAKMITEHPPTHKKTIYCRECWQGDGWDPRDYGQDIDFSRPVFDQIRELKDKVPVQNLLSEGTNQNSEYIHYAGFAKNCYLIMHADFCEDCYYGYGFKKNRSCVDGFYNLGCELCYDCVDCHKCYDLTASQDCANCNTGAFLRDCSGCNNCFLSTGLRNKEFCFENQQLSKEDYQKKIAGIDLRSHEQYQSCRARLKELERKHTFKEFQGYNLENCSGNHLYNCKNVHESFDCEDVETGKFLYQVVTGAKDVYDTYQYGLKLSESYECSIAGNDCYHVLFCHNAHVSCSDVTYCWKVQSTRNCFGCVNMHHKQFCILNKQYTEEQYAELVPKVIEHMKANGEWGELFPESFSPFGYNKTSAQLYYPLTKNQAMKEDIAWDDYEPPPAQSSKTIPAGSLPDNSKDIPDDIVNWAIVCEETGKLFRITQQELAFYRQKNITIPRRSPVQRHLDRFHRRNPRTFRTRKCAKCSKEIRTTYAPQRPEIVYCEDCYLKEVY